MAATSGREVDLVWGKSSRGVRRSEAACEQKMRRVVAMVLPEEYHDGLKDVSRLI